MFVCVLTFHPNQQNLRRPSGRGVWRVWYCMPADRRIRPTVRGGAMMLVTTDRSYKPRSRVDPARMLFQRQKSRGIVDVRPHERAH